MHLSTVTIPINKCISALLRSLLIIFYQTYLHYFCIIFSETIGWKYLVRSSLVTDRILAEHYFCRKLPMNISMDNWYCNRFIHLGEEGRYFLWITVVPQCLQYPLHLGCTHARYTTLCLGMGWTLNFCWNYRSKYETVIEYWCIAMQISTHFVWIKAVQQFFFFNVISHNCSEILDRGRIIALPIITHSSQQTCGKDSCQIRYRTISVSLRD